MKKFLAIILLFIACSSVFASPASRRRRRIHRQEFHQTVIEGEWEYTGSSVEKKLSYKDDLVDNSIYRMVGHYRKNVYYSCREHVYRTYTFWLDERAATDEEIIKYKCKCAMFIIALTALIAVFIGFIYYIFRVVVT